VSSTCEETVVGYLLRMSGEIHDWLTGLRRSDPAAATLVGQALTALMSAGDGLTAPLVVSLADPPRPEVLSAGVLQRVRAGQAPEVAARAYDDTRAFLDDLFPGSADEVDRGAALTMPPSQAWAGAATAGWRGARTWVT
jgi:hypothetical protein